MSVNTFSKRTEIQKRTGAKDLPTGIWVNVKLVIKKTNTVLGIYENSFFNAFPPPPNFMSAQNNFFIVNEWIKKIITGQTAR